MSKLTGTVGKVFERRKGTADTGKRWSVQRFILETDDDKVTCEAWGMRDLEEMQGEEVTVTGRMNKEKYEGKTYERFKIDGVPKVGGTRSYDRDDDEGEGEERPRRRDRDEEDERKPKRDSWRVYLMRGANLLAKCHAACKAVGLEQGEDARTLFIESSRYVKDMPAKPFEQEQESEPEPEPENRDPRDGQAYGDGPENDDEIPF